MNKGTGAFATEPLNNARSAATRQPHTQRTHIDRDRGLVRDLGMAQWDYNIVFPQLSQFFAFNTSQTASTQALFSITYCLFAIPAALFHRRFGYKLGITAALSAISLGPFLLYPAISGHHDAYFIGAVVMLGIGWPALETSLNPLAVELGPAPTPYAGSICCRRSIPSVWSRDTLSRRNS